MDFTRLLMSATRLCFLTHTLTSSGGTLLQAFAAASRFRRRRWADKCSVFAVSR